MLDKSDSRRRRKKKEVQNLGPLKQKLNGFVWISNEYFRRDPLFPIFTEFNETD